MQPAEGFDYHVNCLVVELCAVFEADVKGEGACELTFREAVGDAVPGDVKGCVDVHGGVGEDLCCVGFVI